MHLEEVPDESAGTALDIVDRAYLELPTGMA
jgi:hypothetical protein